jgi:DNA-binding transcriptional MerR regulator
MEQRYSIEELCRLLDMSRRTVRYYVQEGLIAAPNGQKRGAWYDDGHLRQLQQIKEWQAAGFSLDRIKELMEANASPTDSLLALQPKRGEVAVWSRIHIAAGVELNINPERAGLSPEQTRQLYREIGVMIDRMEKDED